MYEFDTFFFRFVLNDNVFFCIVTFLEGFMEMFLLIFSFLCLFFIIYNYREDEEYNRD